MKKTWAEQNAPRIEETLARLVHDEDSKDERSDGDCGLVSFYTNIVGKGQDALSLGEALYYVCGISKKRDTVTLLHGTRLATVELPRRTFERGITQVWWPEELRTDTSGVHCDPLKYADGLEKQAKTFVELGNGFSERVVREAIATLRGAALETVVKFKPKVQGEKGMANYMKRAKQLAENWEGDEAETNDVETAGKNVSKKTAKKAVAKTGKKSAATKAGHDAPKRKSSGHATPKVGATFEANAKGKTYTMKVVKGKDGEVGFQVGKNVYTSVSSAGSAVTGGACNGWKFWKID